MTQTSLTVTISNVATSQHPIGSVNVTIPDGFTGVGSPSISAVPSGKSWTATLNGAVIQLRSAMGSQISPGESVSVTFAATTPCPEGVYNLGLQVKQSNDFNGQGNDIVSGPATVGFTVNGGCTPAGHHLAFGQQPTDIFSDATMTPTVTVRVEDATNALVTGFSGTVSLAFGSNPGGSTLIGGGPVAVSGGIATFPALTAVQAATGTISGYTLIATSDPAVTSATSSAFAVTGQSVFCEFETCTATSGNFNNPTAAENWIGKVTIETGDCPDTSCFVTAYEEATCPESFTCKTDLFVYVPPVNEQGLIVVQIICHSSICPNTGVPGGTDPVYKQLDNGDVIVLERCHNSPPSGEDLVQGCITEIIRNRPGHTIYTIVLPAAGDPKIFK
ncbi:MAG TPA: hypothetical protein VJ922_04225 [Actinomycetota bacterium]|nr:hypothetical protein [Actinomycetota bacterium]